MLIELILALMAGIVLGTITGLTPGLHINLVAALILSFSPALLAVFNPLALGVLIMAMSITHTFVDFIPSLLLGAPEAGTALAVLPGHRLLLEGKGYDAVKLALTGGLLALLLVTVLMPLLVVVVPAIFNFLKNYVGWILLAISASLIIRERSAYRIAWAFLIFLMSGLLGAVVLNRLPLNQPLFPLLSGLFGTSLLLTSLMHRAELPEQAAYEQMPVAKKALVKPVLVGTAASSLVSIFPGIGPAQAAAFTSLFFGELSAAKYLVAMGGISTVSMLFGLITLLTINKARNGSIAIMSEIIGELTAVKFLMLISASLLAAGIAVILSLKLSAMVLSIINRVNYSRLSLAIILIIAITALFISGWLGLLVLVTATAIGIIPVTVKTARSHLMGCIILPVMVYYLV